MERRWVIGNRDWVELAQRAVDGDVEAFGGLVDRFKAQLCAMVHPLTRDWHLAEDVTQEAFTVAFRQLPKLRNTEHFRAWLFSIARKRAANVVRRRCYLNAWSFEEVPWQMVRSRPHGASLGPLAHRPDPKPDPEILGRAWRAIMALPNGYGSLLAMRYAEGMTVDEIAIVLDRTPKAVKAMIYRSTVMAREVLERVRIDLREVYE